jgi:hypothetical protein
VLSLTTLVATPEATSGLVLAPPSPMFLFEDLNQFFSDHVLISSSGWQWSSDQGSSVWSQLFPSSPSPMIENEWSSRTTFATETQNDLSFENVDSPLIGVNGMVLDR